MPEGFANCLAEGLTLFNAGRFFEAHEVWEDAWRQEAGERRRLLQGLILLAAGWLKRDAGRPQGAFTLFSRALSRLEDLPPDCEGVDVDALRLEVPRWREEGACPRPVLAWAGPPQEEGEERMQPFADEQSQVCPYCGEGVEVTVEPLGPSSETYVEDCPVCCRPWVVHVSREGEDTFVHLGREDD